MLFIWTNVKIFCKMIIGDVKRMKKYLKVLLVSLFVFALSFNVVNAEEEKEEQMDILTAPSADLSLPTEGINEVSTNYFQFDDNLTVENDFEATVFFAGSTVKKTGNVDGIAFMAGSSVSASGRSEYGFFAGATVDIQGTIEKDLFAAGSDVKILDESIINRDAYIYGSNVSISSNIGRNLYVAGSTINFDSITINGDVTINASSILFGKNTIINGKLTYNEDATVANIENVTATEIVKTAIDVVTKTPWENYISGVYNSLISVVNMLTLGLIMCLIFRKLTNALITNFKDNKFVDFCKMFGNGFLVLFLVPLVSLLVITTVVGVSSSIVALALYGICIYVSKIFFAFVVGSIIQRKLFKKKENNYISLLIGLGLIFVLSLIPVVSTLSSIITLFTGLGIIYTLTFKENK